MENCYLLADPQMGDAVLIDPGEEADLFLRRIATEDLTLRAIWLTHAHLDHVIGVAPVVERTGVPVYLHPADRPLYEGVGHQGEWLGVPASAPPAPEGYLAEGDTLGIGALCFEVRHVPGHSPGSIALVGHGVAFVGDALFAGSVGRTDLPGGNADTLIASIREKLLALPDETVVYPGHGPETTIGQERTTNPFLTGTYRLV
ncbi:MAG: MBL fold metallo-hydrolase [Gemmatimonadales bacterium]|nr:MBL fold metallo-hydrolase [Gemmatimonadales bacterium]NIN13534.1 MBL fold metallo-hydrolase [Gemmatimonadales bacterium]NIN51528.1 MBL fold metallo-hydrolase [Gemmatimonadales bacterium]NIP08992.1 MBL fold metallo-hydrolase [Gemmatimonadales bacterium]NIR03770.1 MBL fold metallo-hydrolase [Gemmatimonadales bacterium]